MLQTMPVAGVTLLQDRDEINYWDNRPFIGTWVETKNRKADITRNRTIKKKCKRVRTAFTTDQLRALEKTFLENKYINSENRRALSNTLNIGEKCIKIWFQNRRMKEKRGSSESSDSSTDAFGGEVMSPVLLQPGPETSKYDQSNKYTNTSAVHHEPCNYYPSPAFQTNDINEPQVYEPPNNVFTPNNVYGNGFIFLNETNPYPAQYYPSEPHINGHVNTNNAYLYQNQFQYGAEMYHFGLDAYNLHQ